MRRVSPLDCPWPSCTWIPGYYLVKSVDFANSPHYHSVDSKQSGCCCFEHPAPWTNWLNGWRLSLLLFVCSCNFIAKRLSLSDRALREEYIWNDLSYKLLSTGIPNNFHTCFTQFSLFTCFIGECMITTLIWRQGIIMIIIQNYPDETTLSWGSYSCLGA